MATVQSQVADCRARCSPMRDGPESLGRSGMSGAVKVSDQDRVGTAQCAGVCDPGYPDKTRILPPSIITVSYLAMSLSPPIDNQKPPVPRSQEQAMLSM